MFEGLKKIMQRKIEVNTVKSELTWKATGGKLKTETVLLKRSKLPVLGDWGRIYPPVNEDGTWNIMNLVFGGKRNLIKLIILCAIIGLLLYGISEILSGCRVITENPCVQNCINDVVNLNLINPLPKLNITG